MDFLKQEYREKETWIPDSRLLAAAVAVVVLQAVFYKFVITSFLSLVPFNFVTDILIGLTGFLIEILVIKYVLDSYQSIKEGLRYGISVASIWLLLNISWVFHDLIIGVSWANNIESLLAGPVVSLLESTSIFLVYKRFPTGIDIERFKEYTIYSVIAVMLFFITGIIFNGLSDLNYVFADAGFLLVPTILEIYCLREILPEISELDSLRFTSYAVLAVSAIILITSIIEFLLQLRVNIPGDISLAFTLTVVMLIIWHQELRTEK
ncbi:hypothetical protein GKQ38_04365 [Candidatus Nanohaloarchaea archaeon]|nr:hypothetical protein GKQ38_04365 [Candidatus Nanohaloarchaea archaeon]